MRDKCHTVSYRRYRRFDLLGEYYFRWYIYCHPVEQPVGERYRYLLFQLICFIRGRMLGHSGQHYSVIHHCTPFSTYCSDSRY